MPTRYRSSHWLGWLLPAGLLAAGPVRAQAPADSLPTDPAARFARYAARLPHEKLFVHLDRPAYVSGETLWLKVYAVEGTTQRPLAASTVAYVEVLDPAQHPVVQARLPLHDAAGRGALELPAALPTGRYTVRAYTAWMRNFSPAYFFRTAITVVNTRQGPAAPAPASPAPGGYDAQFFPEGGYLVQGLASTVGFKLTDAAGHGQPADGTVLDGTGREVARFKTLWAGMGSFALPPAPAGAAYRAVIRLPGGQTLTRSLPPAQPLGYVLHLDSRQPGPLRLTVQARGPQATGDLRLLVHARQQLALSATAPLRDGQATFEVPRAALVPGVAHFTVFDTQHRPVAERLYFSPPANPLAVQARPDHADYAPRQAVTLRLAAPGARPAHLSVAVYQLDSLAARVPADISSYLWLAADLPGEVEQPARYFDPASPEAAAAADNLMLTQGWRRFRWADVLAARPDSLPFRPELNGPLLRGRLLRPGGQPVAGVPVYVASPSRRVQLYTALSREGGIWQAELPDLYGSHVLVVQPDRRRDSLARLELLPAFAPPPPPSALAAWVPPATQPAGLQRRHAQAEVSRRFPAGPPARYLAPALDSVAFYGTPSERYRLDDYTRFPTLEEVLREYVPGVLARRRKSGFYFIVPDKPNRVTREDPLVLLDGVPVFDTNRLMAFDPLKVQQLEVLTRRYQLGPVLHNGLVSLRTYHGDLAGFEPDPHALLTDYEGLQGQREFYAPRYGTPAQQRSRLPDLRNLLYWNPDVTTRPGQDTTLTFFTSDQAGRYRVVVQGLSDDGRTGSTSCEVEVKPAL